jgi:hypothetical protein
MRCTVARLLGGDCGGAVAERGRVDGEPVLACESHDALAAPLLAELRRRREPKRPGCRHRHASREARAICEARLARAATP